MNLLYKEYNFPKRPHHVEHMKKYAELISNNKKLR
nr:MAG TPA: hypothetical protein [Caudoviricetes sp.]